MDIPKVEGENEASQLAETLETVSLNERDSVTSTMDESLQKENPKNPMLLSPVIRCVLKFLEMEDLKTCRLISSEWGSTGKQTLANRSRIYFHNFHGRPARLPVDFQACFLNSATLFSAFVINANISKEKLDNTWTIEELALFFEEQQSYIKELVLDLEDSGANIVSNIDISAWISKSPMVQKDANYMTRLSIYCFEAMLDIPFLLIAHIKDLKLSHCRIILEAERRIIKICPIEIRLSGVTFFQDERTLDRIRINDIADLFNAKDISLDCQETTTKYVLDLWGNFTLDNLDLEGVELENGETSQWAINHLRTFFVPYSLNRQMKINDIYLADAGAVDVDLFNISNSVEELNISIVGETTSVICSQPIVLENLKTLNVSIITDYSFLCHFTNCPQLSHLHLSGPPGLGNEMKSVWMPKSVKTLTLRSCSINWVDDIYLELDRLVIIGWSSSHYAKELCNAKIRVDEFIVLNFYVTANQDFVEFLEYRKRLGFGNKFYVGEFNWDEENFEESLLKDHVDVQASFYLFENEEKGRALPGKPLFELEPFRSVIF